MHALANTKIITKIVSLIGFIALIVAGGIYFTTTRMSEMSLGYSKFLSDDVLAWGTVARMNRNVFQTRYIAYRLIGETDAERIKAVSEELKKAADEFDRFAKQVVAAKPSAAARLDEQVKKMTVLRQHLSEVAALTAARNTTEAAERMRKVVDPIFNEVSDGAQSIFAWIDSETKAGTAALGDATGSAIRLTIALMAAGLLVGLAGAFLIAQFGIVKPIRQLVACMEVLAKGTYDIEVPGSTRKDEVGVMATAVEVFRQNAIQVERMRAEQVEQERRTAAEKQEMDARAAAELKAAEERAEAERKASLNKLADDFESAVSSIVQNVSSASTELEAAASTLTRTAEMTQNLSGSVAAASEQASANVASVSSATDEMAASVQEIGRQVHESSRIAAEAVKQAGQTDTRIAELSRAAQRIGAVVNMITAVAEQTNLLALNATIEAARAGEAGRGFAVVAQEVKALAAQTAKATDEISSQIAGMQTATNESVVAIKEIVSTIGNISEIAATIAAAVEEQGAATHEISRNIQEAAKGTAQVASNIAEVNKGSTETGTASTQVLTSAQSLSQQSNMLKLQVDGFLSTVRAA